LLLSAIADPEPRDGAHPQGAHAQPRPRGPDELIPGEPEDARALGKMIDAPIG
jgi:hypothetical protein